jgi:glycosyltransferase involved in cell wall biosynthesis
VSHAVKIAWFTPLAPRSAIGEFSVHVAGELAKFAEVELWTSDEPPLLDTDLPVVRYRPGSSELGGLTQRDAIVYNMGDYLPFHGDIHAVSREHPGVVILHDRVLHHLFAGKWLMGPDSSRELYVERMRAYYGELGAEAARTSLEGERRPVWESDEEVLAYPLYEEGILNALGVVVHSESQAVDVRARWVGPVRALHLPCYSDTLRHVDGRPPPAPAGGRMCLLTVGHLNPNKQVHRVVEMLAADPELAAQVTYRVAGPDDGFGAYVEDLRRFIARHADLLDVEILGWQPQDELDRLMSEADIFINLRHPVMEGSSASLMRQLAYGRPVLCFGSGFFGELPGEAVVRVPAGDFVAAANALRELVADDERRRRTGRQARALMASYHERVYVEELLMLIEQSRRAAPALRFLDNVAGELGNMHVDSRLPTFDEIASDFARILTI